MASVLLPGAAHVHPVYSCGPFASHIELLTLNGSLSSLPYDFFLKVSGSGEVQFSFIAGLPLVRNQNPLSMPIAVRAARLNCLTRDFEPLWVSVIREPWHEKSPTRAALARRFIQIELDALVSISLGLSVDELCSIYRTQFPVLRGYERTDLYDANGRKVPGEMNKLYRKVGEAGMTLEDRKWTHPQSGVEYTFEFPFRGFDREEDMRAAYAKFSKMLEEHGEIIEESI